MAGSIKDFLGKIKAAGERILGDRDTFAAILIILVGIISFGLGRLSVTSETPEEPRYRLVENVPLEAAVVSREEATTNTPFETRVPSSATPVVEESAVGTVGGEYVGSKNSNKYHLPWCSGAQRIADANKVWFSSKEAAEAAGYTPAGNCPGI